MMKRLLLVMGLCVASLVSKADEVAMDMMLLNNSNSQQFNDIWSRFRAGFRLEHTQTSRVQYYERLYTKNPKSFNKMMLNAKPYLYFLLCEAERNGLPTELALIPGVESTYDPLAKNPTDAYAGMWQFVPGTGRRFNMVQDNSIDERRDIVKSTRAAFSYLSYLYRMFGQWDVAIGAYNWGEGSMYKAILNSGMPLGHVTYSDLELRQITADYVPKVIALASIIENPGKFGVTLDEMPNEPYFALITPAANTSVSDVSRLSNVDGNTFSRLDPQYKDSGYQLNATSNILLPLANQNIYYANVGQAIVAANGIQLANNTEQAANDNIKTAALVTTIPVESAISPGVMKDAESGNAKAIVTTEDNQASRNSQELNDLLDQIEVSDKPANNVVDSKLAATATTVAISKQNNVVKYTVNSGDTLYSISKKFNADIDRVRTDNKIPGDNLSSGQVLNIRVNSAIVKPAT